MGAAARHGARTHPRSRRRSRSSPGTSPPGSSMVTEPSSLRDSTRSGTAPRSSRTEPSCVCTSTRRESTSVARTEPSPVRSVQRPGGVLDPHGAVARADVQRLLEALRPHAAVAVLTVTATPRGTSIRCLAEQSATTPEQFTRSFEPVVLHRPGHLGLPADATLPLNHRVTSTLSDVRARPVRARSRRSRRSASGPRARRNGARGPCRPRHTPRIRRRTAATSGDGRAGDGAERRQSGTGHDGLPLVRSCPGRGLPLSDLAAVLDALRPYGAGARRGIRAAPGSRVG